MARRPGYEVGRLLTDALHRHRLTPAKLADTLGHSEAAVRRWLRDAVTPRDAHAYELVDQLELDVSEFMAAIVRDRQRRQRHSDKLKRGGAAAVIFTCLALGGGLHLAGPLDPGLDGKLRDGHHLYSFPTWGVVVDESGESGR
jgi:hypothetical protein